MEEEEEEEERLVYEARRTIIGIGIDIRRWDSFVCAVFLVVSEISAEQEDVLRLRHRRHRLHHEHRPENQRVGDNR